MDQLILKTPIDDSYEEDTGEMVIVIDKVKMKSSPASMWVGGGFLFVFLF